MVKPLPPEFSDPARWNENLSAAQRKQIIAALENEKFQALLDETAKQPRELLLAYLEQEGWKDDKPFALVDIGWRATTAGALDKTLTGASLNKPLRYYFFGLFEDAHEVVGPAVAPFLVAWFFDDASKHGYLPFMRGTIQLMEMFCAADHGTVVGYERQGDKIVPRLKEETSAMNDWGFPLLRATTNKFVDLLIETIEQDTELVELHIDVRNGIRQVLELFWLHPTKEEAEHWGSFPTDLNFNNTLTHTLVEPIGLASLVKSVRAGKPQIRQSYTWAHGTAMTSPFVYRFVLTFAWRLRDRTPQLKNRLKWLKEQAALFRSKKIV